MHADHPTDHWTKRNPITQYAEPSLETFYTGEEGQLHAECVHCGDDIFLDQELDPEAEEMTPPVALAYWQHNDDRYRPNRLSWCKP